MKNSTRLLAFAFALVTASLAAMLSGCKYDVEDPLWEKPYPATATPAITQVSPSSAPAGVNTIVLTGQNLTSVASTNGVYFGTTAAEVVSRMATSITVRRPNLVADSCTIKVVPDSTLIVAKIQFGKIDQVMTRYGSFADGIKLGAVTADSAGNLLILSGVSPITIWRITPGGDKTIMAWSGVALRPPTDALVKGGEIYLMGNNREIQKVSAQGVSSAWTRMPSGKVVKFGDFDSEGYFYTGGAAGTDLCIVPPNPPATLTTAGIKLSGYYATEEILYVRHYGGSLYVAAKATGAAPRVWKHAVSNGGTLGAQEPVLNLGGYAELSTRSLTAFALASDGKLFVTTNDPNPLLIFNPADGTMDFFYKGILPSYGVQAYWGASNYLYMVSGDVTNTDVSLQWNIARINMGMAGSPR